MFLSSLFQGATQGFTPQQGYSKTGCKRVCGMTLFSLCSETSRVYKCFFCTRVEMEWFREPNVEIIYTRVLELSTVIFPISFS